MFERSPRRPPILLILLLTLFPLAAAADGPLGEQHGPFTLSENCGNSGRSSTEIQDRFGRWDIEIRRGRCSLEIEMRGDIEFTPDEAGIATIDRRARFDIREKAGREERRLTVTNDGDGVPVYDWEIDGWEADFDDDGRAWLAHMLPMIFRYAGLDVEGRVERFLARGGVEAVLEEIAFLSSDHLERRYFEELMRQAELDDSELISLLEAAREQISSDYELAELLINEIAGDVGSPSVRQAYAQSTEAISSDYEMRRALTALLERRHLDQETLDTVFGVSRAIASDYELAELLIATIRVYPGEGPLPEGFFQAAGTLASDYEQRRVLQAAVDRRELTRETVEALLDSSREVASDYEQAEFLIALARAYPIDDEMRPLFTRALDSVGSRHERDRVLDALERRR